MAGPALSEQRPRGQMSRRDFLRLTAIEGAAEVLGVGPLSQMVCGGVEIAKAGGFPEIPRAGVLIVNNTKEGEDSVVYRRTLDLLDSNGVGSFPDGTRLPVFGRTPVLRVADDGNKTADADFYIVGPPDKVDAQKLNELEDVFTITAKDKFTHPENATKESIPVIDLDKLGLIFPDQKIETPQMQTEAAKAQEKQAQTLREILDQKGITLGVNVDNSVNMNRDAQLITDNFNMVVPGYFSWGWIRRNGQNVNTIDFNAADRWVNFALSRGMRVRNGNPLVYNVNLPDWLTQGKFTNDQLRTILQEHIAAVVGYFKGRVHEWIVCNEAYIYYDGHRGIQTQVNETKADFPFATQLGEEYIDLAFQTARQADPSATLIYNDFGIEYPGPKADWIFENVKKLKERGLIDAVGMEYHIGAPPVLYFQNINPNQMPSKEDLISQIRRYAEIGVKVIITELDVDLNSLPGKDEKERLIKQAEIYRIVAEVALESGNCNSMTVWGLNDDGSWMNSVGGKSPLLFSNGQPKPAFEAIVDVLSK